MPAFLTTPRLTFREWREDDFPLVKELWGNAEITRFTGGPFSDEYVRERLAKEMRNVKDTGVQYWPMFLKDSSTLVGCCGMRPTESEDHVFEMGFYLKKEFWRQGFAAEASLAVMRYAFETLGATALTAGHHPENTGSKHVLEKVGFHFTHNDLYPPTSLQHPNYRISKQEFKSLDREAFK